MNKRYENIYNKKEKERKGREKNITYAEKKIQ